ncbi:MAG: hypothetical protein AAFW46_00860 [Pseudomonadota bacterium]
MKGFGVLPLGFAAAIAATPSPSVAGSAATTQAGKDYVYCLASLSIAEDGATETVAATARRLCAPMRARYLQRLRADFTPSPENVVTAVERSAFAAVR